MGNTNNENPEVETALAADLHGAVPPAPQEPEHESEPKIERNQRGLGQWGPWKRWKRYREIQGHYKTDSERRKQADAEENVRGRLPDDEEVQVPAIWVCELYTPSTVDGLLKGLASLGWDISGLSGTNLTKWMSDARAGRLAGWINLGLVSPPGTKQFVRERVAPLPFGVMAALPLLISLTPSLTSFIVVFLLDESTATSLETPLRAELRTKRRRDPRHRYWQVARYILTGTSSAFYGYSEWHPDMVRREMVDAKLKEIENGCISWVRTYLPGVFASLQGSRYPTAALMVTDQARPMTKDAFAINAFSGLAISRDYDAWESDEWAGARLVLPRSWDDDGNRLVFGCRRHDAFPEESGWQEPTSNWTIAQRADELVRKLVTRWAISCLLDSYHEALSALRDQIAHDGGYRTVRDLKNLRTLARTTLYDIGVCTQEIVDFTDADREYRHDVIEMTYVRGDEGNKTNLVDALRTSQSKRALQIQREAELLHSALSTSNDLSQTITNIRIQRFLVVLTILSLVVASTVFF